MGVIQKISVFLSFLLCAIQLQGFRDLGVLRLIVFGIWLLFIIIALGQKKSKILGQQRFLALFVFVLFYFFSSFVIVPFNTSINRCVDFLCVASPVLMYELFKGGSRKLRLSFVLFTSFFFIANFILSYQFLDIANTDSFRDASEYGKDFYVIYVSFNMCYAISLATPAFWGVYKESSYNRVLKYFLLGVIVLLFLYLLRSQFMTAIIIAVIGVSLEIIYRRKMNFVGASIAFFVIVGVFLLVILPFTIKQFQNRGDYEVVTLRLIEINDVITGNNSQALDINTRNDLRSMSFTTFIENPVFGVNHRISANQHVIEQGVGNHAEWVDCLAKFGLFSLFFFFFVYDSLRRQRKDYYSPITMIMFILLGFLNPLWMFPQIFSTFLYIPLLNSLSKDNNRFIDR